MKMKVQEMNVDNKRIVLRCDFNVPIKNGVILDDTKIVASLETINYLVSKNCRVIILSHLGKVKSEEDKLKNSLAVVAKRLNELVESNVIFSTTTRSPELEMRVKALQPREILVVENTRFEDYPQKLESGNDIQLASYWASLGDIFVMDAFGSSHRCHASTAGIAKFLPSCIGFLVQKELMMLNDNVLHAKRLFTIIMGGAKIEDKLELMNKLLPKCDYMLVVGALANSCLKALGLYVGDSLATSDNKILTDVRSMLAHNKSKIMLPFDVIVGKSYNDNYVMQKNVNEIIDDEMIFDVGPITLKKYYEVINKSKTVFLNGTVGKYEDEKFANGTKELFRMLKESGAAVVAGGGDCVSAITNFGYRDSYTYLSTGGGATLEYIINEKCPALDYIMDEEEIL